MSKDYEQHDEEIDIPKGAGVAGMLEAIRGVLTLPRVMDIHIKAPGKITYTFFLRKGEQKKDVTYNFDDVMPYAIVRNAKIEEIPYPDAHAAAACGQLFQLANRDHMYPVAFLGGEKSSFWDWYEDSTGRRYSMEEELFGFPFLTDRMMENSAILLCTAYRRGGSIIDTIKSYKITVPQVRR